MRGIVFEINGRRGMVAVQVETGFFSVFSLARYSYVSLHKGDILEWKGDWPHGQTTVRNLTQRQTFEVHFERHWVTPDDLRHQLSYD